MLKISASILSSDLANLKEELRKIEDAGVDYIHVDVMDGHFVPNITFGPDIVKAIKKHTSLPLDVHLMISEPGKYVKAFIDAGADILIFHVEATKDCLGLIRIIKEAGVKAGISLNPSTPASELKPFIEQLDWALVMSVNPGFSGQKFIDTAVEKIKAIKAMRSDLTVAIDGGINAQTAPSCIKAGVDVLVSGAYLFSGDYKTRIETLRKS